MQKRQLYKNVSPQVFQTDPVIRSYIRVVIARLIGDHDRIYDQEVPLRREMLANDMKDREGHVLDAIWYCTENGTPPTFENVVAFLEISKRMPNANEFINQMLLELEGDHSRDNIRFLSNYIQVWFDERKLHNIGAIAQTIADDMYMDYSEKHQAISNLLMEIAPGDTFVQENLTEEEFKMLVWEENQETMRLRAEGMDIGPCLPFAGQQALFPHFRWGAVTTAMGQPGSGKSTIMDLLSENICWNQKLDCDFIMFSTETPLEERAQRQFSRHNLIPYLKMIRGDINLNTSKWKPIWDRWINTKRQNNNNLGYIRYFFSPSANVFQICNQMLRTAEASRTLGRKVCFGVDALSPSSFDWEATHASLGEFGALRAIHGMMSRTLSIIAAKGIRAHLFIAAQEGDTRGQMFGGKIAKQRSQYVFSIDRKRFGDPDENGYFPKAGHDLLMTFDKNSHTMNNPMFKQHPEEPNKMIGLDALGEQRYWYRVGDEYNHIGTMELTKSNYSPPGVIRLKWESRLSIVSQDQEQIRDLEKAGIIPPGGR